MAAGPVARSRAQIPLRLCLGHERSEIAHMVTFFFRRFRDMCQLFKLVRQISQNP